MIRFHEVTKKYGEGEPVLSNVSFIIERGSFVHLIGPTGSGKTTVFRLIIRDILPTEGEISIGEWNLIKLPSSKVTTLRRKVGVIFQDLKLLMDRTVIENVMLPLQMSGVSDHEARERATTILGEVGLEEKINSFPLQLSGGERQRVAIARALIFDPEIVLADEPTGNLDMQTSFQILELLKSINAKSGTTVFMATHNDRLVEKSGDRVIVISRGKIIDDKKGTKKSAGAPQESKKAKNESSGAKKEEPDKKEKNKNEKINLETLASNK